MVGNEIVVVGGRTGGQHPGEVTQTEIFNGKSWHDAASIPVPGDHLGAVTDGTYLYALGGRTLEASSNHNAVQRFDPATNQWTQLTPLPVANSDMGAAYVGGQLITFGGENGLKVSGSVRAYDLASKTWSTLPSMADPRHGMGVVVIGNTIYAIDGAHCPGTTDPPTPCRHSSRPCPRHPFRSPGSGRLGHFSPFPVQQLPAAVLNQSQIWVAGGLTGNSEATDTATNKTEYYDTVLHVWSKGPNLPFAVHHAMMVNYRGQLWLIGGFLPQGHEPGGGRLEQGAEAGRDHGPVGRRPVRCIMRGPRARRWWWTTRSSLWAAGPAASTRGRSSRPRSSTARAGTTPPAFRSRVTILRP